MPMTAGERALAVLAWALLASAPVMVWRVQRRARLPAGWVWAAFLVLLFPAGYSVLLGAWLFGRVAGPLVWLPAWGLLVGGSLFEGYVVARARGQNPPRLHRAFVVFEVVSFVLLFALLAFVGVVVFKTP